MLGMDLFHMCRHMQHMYIHMHIPLTHTMKREKGGGREKQGRENLFQSLGLSLMSYISCLILK